MINFVGHPTRNLLLNDLLWVTWAMAASSGEKNRMVSTWARKLAMEDLVWMGSDVKYAAPLLS